MKKISILLAVAVTTTLFACRKNCYECFKVNFQQNNCNTCGYTIVSPVTVCPENTQNSFAFQQNIDQLCADGWTCVEQ